MNFLEKRCGVLEKVSDEFVLHKDECDKVVAFEKGGCVFIFNFHPNKSYEGYGIETRFDFL
jgi:1,4-alpha-glucan branching enzyme